MNFSKKIIFLPLLLLLLAAFFSPIWAQDIVEKTMEGEITTVLEENKTEDQLYQKLEVLLNKGDLAGQKVTVETGSVPAANQPRFLVGDQVLVVVSKDFEGNDVFYIADFIRRQTLLSLFLIFIILVIAVGRWRGVGSLFSLAASFLVILLFVLPQINQGKDPVLMSILASFLIIPLMFYLSHGVNNKTTAAVLGTLIALAITGFLAKISVTAAKLTGFTSDEAGFLQIGKGGIINMKGLVLAGIIIGALGVLDDVTVSQSSVVQQLRKANPKIKPFHLFTQALSVGQDHIASMVNTLILVYTGASFPLLLLFIDNPQPFSQVINYEIIAEEIVRTLTGSIGLILAVPITTILAVKMIRN